LFGQAQEYPEADAAVTQTRLQLKLLGVFTLSQAAETARVIIQAEDGAQKTYKTGDELPGGASLEGIDGKQVVLLHNGRRESLALQRHDAVSTGNAE
jgi:general secretion pathway protein C